MEKYLFVIAELRVALSSWELISDEWEEAMKIAEVSGLEESHKSRYLFEVDRGVRQQVIERLRRRLGAVYNAERGTPVSPPDPETGPQLLRRLIQAEWAEEESDPTPDGAVSGDPRVRYDVLEQLLQRCDRAEDSSATDGGVDRDH